jgi:hypothetical protein
VAASVPFGTSEKPEARVPGAAVIVPTVKFARCAMATVAKHEHNEQTSITLRHSVIALPSSFPLLAYGLWR